MKLPITQTLSPGFQNFQVLRALDASRARAPTPAASFKVLNMLISTLQMSKFPVA